ncbi:hypothetical protein A3D85_00090 [Candidatus Amesbacteria bacterium RIFCSPHIGHO2_02_FULL_47_9]|uniref:Peptidase C45 hydrolase domain-containing protein n=1 Tax=Candidatus Amesbacteria bacterium RIFCSPHIGHO2_01_FULL_48_32b TaxID=1797253 RepID=A0A1F4YGS2_9BACT|nr:MAG: hypothetical protein A2876_00835 [Candidatus Amesbacteria bacterium RIFCSPHIGHO2_01_FULL_48_32b]OGD03186.1 MAG: hypothetical protein A3D85_00090 [Candidatus Amesbacteria bacterium RIFCSPHIGHO2_02_FULL_47_9]OGD07438.1 MAG: hypothetical protein A2899_04000 [Candidatus Amesbacteria bacterium RIFCSPLOWO2_01_FULL_49_25]
MNHPFLYLEFYGSHAELGHFLGQTFRSEISRRVKKLKILPVDPYIQAAQKAFPEILVEAQSMAQAARVSFADFFLLNCSELSHCTTVFTHLDNQPVVAHNEDSGSDGETSDDLYILKAKIGNTTILGLHYKHQLIGTSVSINNWGLVQCIDNLHPHSQIGVPRNFVARAVLECRSLAQAKQLLSQTPHASGYNHFLIQDDELLNIAVSPQYQEVEQSSGNHFVHTNHFLTPRGLAQEIYQSQESIDRYQKASRLAKDHMTQVETLALLTVCQDSTLARALLFPTQGKILIQNPSSPDPTFTPYFLELG